MTAKTGSNNDPLTRKFEVLQPHLTGAELAGAGFEGCVCGRTGKACVRAVAIHHPKEAGPAALECLKRGKRVSADVASRCPSMKLAA